jgi:hypothetical protein
MFSQMVCIEFTTRAGRPIRLFGCLVEATDEHLLVDSIEGGSTRPGVGEQVVVSMLIGRAVQQASTTVLVGGEPGGKRVMVRRPVAFSDSNRRRHERLGVSAAVTWFAVDRGPSAFATGKTVDLSIGGLLFTSTGASVSSGERIVLLIELPGRTVAGICVVRSAREDNGTWRIGVEWTAIAELDRAALAQAGS